MGTGSSEIWMKVSTSDAVLSTPADRQQERTKVWLVVAVAFAGLLLLPWLGFALFAAMIGWPYILIDEGWSLSAFFFSLLLLYPLYFVGCALASRALYQQCRYGWAALAAISPVLIAMLLVALWAMSG